MEVFILDLTGFRDQALKDPNNQIVGVAGHEFKILFNFAF